jgi:hypothetical protein
VDATVKGAQTFTAEKTVRVTDAQAYVLIYRTGDLTMQITTVDSSGNPTNNVLASTTIADPPLSDQFVNPQPVTGNFSNPAAVASGNKYALVLSTTATNNPYNIWGNYARNKPAGPTLVVRLCTSTTLRRLGSLAQGIHLARTGASQSTESERVKLVIIWRVHKIVSWRRPGSPPPGPSLCPCSS